MMCFFFYLSLSITQCACGIPRYKAITKTLSLNVHIEIHLDIHSFCQALQRNNKMVLKRGHILSFPLGFIGF